MRLRPLRGTLRSIRIGRLGLYVDLGQRDCLPALRAALIVTVGSPGTSAKPTLVPFGTAVAEHAESGSVPLQP
jgi:hypothetical protein